MKDNVAVLLMCATTIIMVAGMARGVTNYWNEKVSDVLYDSASETMMEKCWNDLSGDTNFEIKEVSESGKIRLYNVFSCSYQKSH